LSEKSDSPPHAASSGAAASRIAICFAAMPLRRTLTFVLTPTPEVLDPSAADRRRGGIGRTRRCDRTAGSTPCPRERLPPSLCGTMVLSAGPVNEKRPYH